MVYTVIPLSNGDCWLVQNKPKFSGKGNFCGFYSTEFVSEAEVVACLDDDLCTPILFDKPKVFNEEVRIISSYVTSKIRASSLERAYEKFVEYVSSETFNQLR